MPLLPDEIQGVQINTEQPKQYRIDPDTAEILGNTLGAGPALCFAKRYALLVS